MTNEEKVTDNNFEFEDINKEDIINIIDKPYKFIYLDFKGNISMINAFDLTKYNKEKYSNSNKKFQIEVNIINKKDVDRNIKLIDGIIYIFNNEEEKEIIIDIIDYIQKVEKDCSNKTFFPIFILGDKKEFQNFLNINNIDKIKNIQFLKPMHDINKTINLTLDEFIKIKKIVEKYEIFLKENEINEKDYINTISNKKINILKCIICHEVLDISIDTFSKLCEIKCDKCKYIKKLDILNFENFEKNMDCFECKKQPETNSLNYCFKCKKYFCVECSKNHLQKEDKEMLNNNNILFPNNLIDVICNVHNKFLYNYCIDCKKDICIECEIESHILHKTSIYDINYINNLIFNQKKDFEIEKVKFNAIKIVVDDCLNSLRNYIDKLMIYKEKEINLKEKIIEELELFKFNNTLINNMKNLEFRNYKDLIYNSTDTWDKKLTNIFEFFNEPVKIENIKLCLKDKLKGPFNFLQQIDLKNNTSLLEVNEISDIVTDICPLYNYLDNNYFAVSFNTGLLKIYNDNFDNKMPIKIIKEFEEYESINCLYKSLGNSLILVSNSKIKKINLSQDLKEYSVINKIEVKDELFKIVLELNLYNVLLTINNFNHLIFYDLKNGNQLFNVTDFIDSENEKEISFMDIISENKIIIQYSSIFDLFEINLERETMKYSDPELDLENFDSNNDIRLSLLRSNTFDENSINGVIWKIIEFEIKGGDIKIKNIYSFNKNLIYLGKINEESLLLFDIKLKNLISFNHNLYKNTSKIPFKYKQIPKISFILSKRDDIVDFLFACEEGYLSQYSINSKLKFIHENDRIKIDLKNEENKKSLPNSDSLFNENKENKKKNEIIKMINLTKTSFLLITKKNSIYKV